MTDHDRHRVAVLDTSVVIDLDRIDKSRLPMEAAIAAVTLAELSAGLHMTNDPIERAARMARLQVIEANSASVVAAFHAGLSAWIESLSFDPAFCGRHDAAGVVLFSFGDNLKFGQVTLTSVGVTQMSQAMSQPR
jgi:hypothetical protein